MGCQINESTRERCSTSSLVVCSKKIRKIMQEIACLSTSKMEDALPYLEKTRDDMRRIGYDAKNPFLFDFYGTPFRTSTDKVANASMTVWEEENDDLVYPPKWPEGKGKPSSTQYNTKNKKAKVKVTGAGPLL